MSFLLADWTRTNTFRSSASTANLLGAYVRDDGVRLEFIRYPDGVDVACFMPDGERRAAGVRRHARRGVVLIPPQSPGDRQRANVAFWLSRPTIHYAARDLAARDLGPIIQENA